MVAECRNVGIFGGKEPRNAHFSGLFGLHRSGRFSLARGEVLQPLLVLEMLCGETHLGFESLTLRQKKRPTLAVGLSFCQKKRTTFTSLYIVIKFKYMD